MDPINDLKFPIEAWMFIGMVLGATGLILLIACFNIANMQLARAIARQKEIGVRLCLGASRWRLVRQLLTESLLLSVVGGIAGVMLAWWSLNLFLSVIFLRYGGPEMVRIAVDLTPDWRVMTYSFGLALLSGMAFGLVPALRGAPGVRPLRNFSYRRDACVLPFLEHSRRCFWEPRWQLSFRPRRRRQLLERSNPRLQHRHARAAGS